MPGGDIVVIGGSAGGLTALQAVLHGLPQNLRATVFVVLHTSQNSPGLLPDLLNRVSALPALYAVQNAPILPGRIYLAPPDHHLMVDRGRVRLSSGPRENRHRPAVDVLFRSASQAYGSRVIGVVLSGNLDDGSAGLMDIKARGGMAIVQDPEDADAPSMPTNAIASTEVDYIVPADQIGPRLVSLVMEEKPETPAADDQNLVDMPEGGSRFACPECGGALVEFREGDMPRFRCRVGHTYSPESLLEDQSEALERALWAAIRSLEEHSEFLNRLAERSSRQARQGIANRFKERSDSSREHATVLRELLNRAVENREIETEDATGT
jgi:two-component system chemotaxis response regulator CheB